MKFSHILPSCHSESWASETQAWAAYNVHIVTMVPDNCIQYNNTGDWYWLSWHCMLPKFIVTPEKEKIGRSMKKEPSGQIQITIMLLLVGNNNKRLNGAALDCCRGRNDQKGSWGGLALLWMVLLQLTFSKSWHMIVNTWQPGPTLLIHIVLTCSPILPA